MAQYRQSGMDRSVVRSQDIHHANGASTDQFSIGIRASSQSYHKGFRHRRSYKLRNRSFTVVSFTLSIVLSSSILAFYFLLRDHEGTNTINHLRDYDIKRDLSFLTNLTRANKFKVLKFGNGSVSHGWDSRYWDRDDRRRDEDYDELEHSVHKVNLQNGSKKNSSDGGVLASNQTSAGLYKKLRHDEPKMYEVEHDPSLSNRHANLEVGRENAIVSVDDEYDDGLGSHDSRMDSYKDKVQSSADLNAHDGYSTKSLRSLDKGIPDMFVSEDGNSFEEGISSKFQSKKKISGVIDQSIRKINSEMLFDSKKKAKRRKFSGSTCVMKLLNSTAQLVEPLENPKFVRFSLHYTESEEKPIRQEDWEPKFAGHQTLEEREKSFLAEDQEINCGFVKGPKGSPSTGFDLAEDDTKYISSCHIAVISCIFGNSDRLRSPTSKSVTHHSRKNVCFVMFMDEISLLTLSSEGQSPDSMGFVGLWRIVVVKNLPYNDMRRVGKIPKLLPHRLFPSARYSIWLDSKLRLEVDPILILEYLLWRKGYEFAISNHYDRHCLWEEVAQNKKLNKYNHTIIDQQFSFYQADGLKKFNASDPDKLLPSNVPEGSFIVRAHTPMSCLFSCLWFNEVERFTPRDQLSFAYTYQKLKTMNPTKTFRLNMFKDCERRVVAKLFHHRSDEKRHSRPPQRD